MCIPGSDPTHFHPPLLHLPDSTDSPLAGAGTTRYNLEPVDSAEVTVLVDNFVDVLMAGNEHVRRPAMPEDFFDREQLIAEHGYSLLVTVKKDGHSATVLYDAGLSRNSVLHNMEVLGLNLTDVRAIILSHGHADHHGGLEGIIQRLGRKTPLVLHPDAWLKRRVVYPSGAEMRMPPPHINDLDREGVEVIEERAPTLLVDNMILVTGQVERTTSFEKGFPPQQAFIDGKWQSDIWLWDDQGLVINVKDKGLVVLSSCSHSGSINVMLYARRLTGVEKIHSFIGGLHLTGPVMEPVIEPTLTELVKIAPDVLVPGHCSGWKAMHRLSHLLPESFIQPSVGSRFIYA